MCRSESCFAVAAADDKFNKLYLLINGFRRLDRKRMMHQCLKNENDVKMNGGPEPIWIVFVFVPFASLICIIFASNFAVDVWCDAAGRLIYVSVEENREMLMHHLISRNCREMGRNFSGCDNTKQILFIRK